MGSIWVFAVRLWSAVLLTMLLAQAAPAAGQPASRTDGTSTSAVEGVETRGVIQLGPGDKVTLSVFGQPEMNTTTFVADDGSLAVPLVGSIQVNGVSLAEASHRIEKALRDGKFLVDPQVTISAIETHSQRVSVLGEVAKPGRYVVDSNVAIYDLLADAGGVTENGSETAYLLHTDKNGNTSRYEINLKGLTTGNAPISSQSVQAGDTILVPRAEQFYVYGEVSTPGRFRLEPDMTVIQAIARAGGITIRGSQRRVEIKRRQSDGTYLTTKATLSDLVKNDDVIRVKESIF